MITDVALKQTEIGLCKASVCLSIGFACCFSLFCVNPAGMAH